MGKTKTLCHWDKSDYSKKHDKLKEIVSQPRYTCKECGRAVNKKKYVCSPLPLVQDE